MEHNYMRRIFVWTICSLAILALGFVLLWLKLGHDMDVALQEELGHRFSTAASQVKVLDGAPEPSQPRSERDRALIGQAVVAEVLMGFRVAGYQSQHGALPTSIEALDATEKLRQLSPPDPWGNPYGLYPEGTNLFLIVSGGVTHNARLTEEEREKLRKQPAGHLYQLHGKIIFEGGLPDDPQENQGHKAP